MKGRKYEKNSENMGKMYGQQDSFFMLATLPKSGKYDGLRVRWNQLTFSSSYFSLV